MSTCLKKETLLALLDEELASGEVEFAERHIAACSSCQQQLDSIRTTSLKVNALLSSLASIGSPEEQLAAIIRIPYKAANASVRWAAVASVGVLAAAVTLFAMIRRPDSVNPPNVAKTAAPAPAPVVERQEIIAATVKKPAPVGAPKVDAKVRQFQALDNGAPIETGMIYRVSLPATTSPHATATQSAKRIPAEVIVDEFGKVRAIRYLQ